MLFPKCLHISRRILVVLAALAIFLLYSIGAAPKLSFYNSFKNFAVTDNLTSRLPLGLGLIHDRNFTDRIPLPSETNTTWIKYCTMNPSDIHGRINISLSQTPMKQLEKKYEYLKPGGHYIPQDCTAKSRIAVVIPFRDREEHLNILLNHMHAFLTKQKLDYSIIVVEQVAGQTLNRAKLLNVGFVEEMKLYNWQCFLFHDVDVLPEDDRNLHTCPFENPRHMAVAMNKFGYKLVYDEMFGTSSALTVEQFRKTNGFSNRYWGWGGEDDDMYTRVVLAGYKVVRYNETIARYTMIKHDRDKKNPINKCRYKLLNLTKRDWKTDGLNSLAYKLVNITMRPLFTHIFVDLLEEEERTRVEEMFC